MGRASPTVVFQRYWIFIPGSDSRDTEAARRRNCQRVVCPCGADSRRTDTINVPFARAWLRHFRDCLCVCPNVRHEAERALFGHHPRSTGAAQREDARSAIGYARTDVTQVAEIVWTIVDVNCTVREQVLVPAASKFVLQ